MARFELNRTIFKVHAHRDMDGAPEFVLMNMILKTMEAELLEVLADGWFKIAVPSLQVEMFKKRCKKERFFGREFLPDGKTKFM